MIFLFRRPGWESCIPILAIVGIVVILATKNMFFMQAKMQVVLEFSI